MFLLVSHVDLSEKTLYLVMIESCSNGFRLESGLPLLPFFYILVCITNIL